MYVLDNKNYRYYLYDLPKENDTKADKKQIVDGFKDCFNILSQNITSFFNRHDLCTERWCYNFVKLWWIKLTLS